MKPSTITRERTIYACRCGNQIELHIRVSAVVCVRCGQKMRPLPSETQPARGQDS